VIRGLANALVPIFVGLLLGYAAGMRKIVDNKNVKILITFVMSFALPCSLFISIALTPRHFLWDQSKVAAVLTIGYLIVFAMTYYAAQRIGKDSAANSAVIALTLGFPNATAVGIPLLLAVYGAQASVTVAVSIAIGAITISPITLAILEGDFSQREGTSTSTRIRGSIWKAMKRPVFWAPFLGVVCAVVNFGLPSYFVRSLTLLGNATAGTALFLTGLVVSAQRFNLNWGVGWSVFAKNLVQPALCLAASHLVNLSPEATRYVVLIAALPCGFFGIVFGKGFNATPEVASSSLIASYALSTFTLAGWIVLLSYLH
jgi:malonate transporter and related proteins